MKLPSIAVTVGWGSAILFALQPVAAAADSVGPYGVNRVTMVSDHTDGRPLTFSESDIFACVKFPGERTARIYRVPYGYATDQTSVPRRAIALVVGDDGFNSMYANAAIVHDYLYAVGPVSDDDTWSQADQAMGLLLESELVDHRIVDIIGYAFDFNRARDDATRAHIAKKFKTVAGRFVSWAADFLFGSPLKTWLSSQESAFGKEREWRRWANPYSLEPLSEAYGDRSGLPPARLTLRPSGCQVFDDRTHPEHILLHTCLHKRYSTGVLLRERVPVLRGGRLERLDWPRPRMPLPLEHLLSAIPDDSDCSTFAD